jgi:hypothetical protein
MTTRIVALSIAAVLLGRIRIVVSFALPPLAVAKKVSKFASSLASRAGEDGQSRGETGGSAGPRRRRKRAPPPNGQPAPTRPRPPPRAARAAGPTAADPAALRTLREGPEAPAVAGPIEALRPLRGEQGALWAESNPAESAALYDRALRFCFSREEDRWQQGLQIIREMEVRWHTRRVRVQHMRAVISRWLHVAMISLVFFVSLPAAAYI